MKSPAPVLPERVEPSVGKRSEKYTESFTPGITVAPVTPLPMVPMLYAQFLVRPLFVAAIQAAYEAPVTPVVNPAAVPFQ